MNCYGGTDLARAYRTVRENTIKIAEEIPESKYDFSAAPGIRTVRQLLTHIALSDGFATFHKDKRTNFEGVNFPALVGQMQAEEAKPRTKAERDCAAEAAWRGDRGMDRVAERRLPGRAVHAAGRRRRRPRAGSR